MADDSDATPKQIQTFAAYREDGTQIYGGVLRGDLAFFADGHPYVYRLVVQTYVLAGEEEVTVDRSPERVKTWDKRNGRQRQ